LAKAYVDTTVLADIVLKHGQPQEQGLAALRSFEITQLPVYAIKEFKRGPLANFTWLHNKFVTTQSFAETIAALQAVSRTPKRYLTSTALEAVVKAGYSIAQETPSTLAAKYGANAEMDKIYCDEYRLSLKKTIFQAWSSLRSVTTETVQPLSCYDEKPPYEKRGMIELDPKKCDLQPTCCLVMSLKLMASDLKKMREAIQASGSDRQEDQRRSKALKQVYHTKTAITDDVCRALGDAIIVAYAPPGATILTTNVRDHTVLANAVGKQVQSPKEIVERDRFSS
jgi:hypothetical protein